MKWFVFFLAVVLLSGCSASEKRGAFFTAGQKFEKIDWTDEELAEPVAVRLWRKTPEASYHFIHLTGAEKPPPPYDA